MSEIELPTDAEGQDLGWHALNYRTAHILHAQAMYEELERYVRDAIAAERERCAQEAESFRSNDRAANQTAREIIAGEVADDIAAAIRAGYSE